MKYLALALLLCSPPSPSNAGCTGTTPFMNEGMTHCLDNVDEMWHPVGSSWRNSRCSVCTCRGCCDRYDTPWKFPDYCVKVFDPEACKYIVYKKDDPSVLCPVYAGVGK